MKKYSHGLLHGRFQPFHNGHLYLIKKALESVEKLTIGIGSANVCDSKNPFTYKQRKEMIKNVIQQEKLSKKIKTIVPLDDFYDDNLWFDNIIKQTGKIDVVIGNNQWSNRIFESKNIPVIRIKYYRRKLYEGWRIRELIKSKLPWQKRVPKYIVKLLNGYIVESRKIQYKYNHVALGGTFDHFHIGHEKLIETAFQYGQNVSIGITNDKMNQVKTLTETIQKLGVRREELEKYLKHKKYLSRSKQYVLHDVFGPTIKDGTIEALVLNKMNFHNARLINLERKKRNLPMLEYILVEDVLADDGKMVSSERIRIGEIDRNGESYWLSVIGYSGKKKKLYLPDNLREELRIPLGKVVTTTNKVVQSIGLLKPTMTIAVGDIIYNSLINEGFIPDLGIIDYRSRRKDIQDPHGFLAGRQTFQPRLTAADLHGKINLRKSASNQRKSTRVINQPGTINFKAVEAIKATIDNYLRLNHPQGVIVDGEEDLLALPAILLAPLGSVVMYGQYGLGVIVVAVTEEIKKKIMKILEEFD